MNTPDTFLSGFGPEALRTRRPLRSLIACVTLSFLSLGFAHAQTAPVTRYDFENASALGTDSSSSATTHDGTVNGSPTQDSTDAKVGSSSIRMFGDQNQYIEVPDHSELDATDQLTVSFWVKPTATGLNTGGRGIVSKRMGYNNQVSYSLFQGNGGGELTLYLDDGDSEPNLIYTEYDFQTSWQHVALVFDGTLSTSERVKLYVNGSLFNTYGHPTSQIRDLSGPLTIGSLNPDYNPGGGGYVSYDGWLDDVQVHRAALGASEVSDLYGQVEGPIAYYDFENSSDLGVDTSGSATVHDGTVNGTPSQDADAVVGSSSIRMFGDQNQYIEVPDHSELDATTGLTVAFWAKPTASGLNAGARGIISKRVAYNNQVSYSLFQGNGGGELVLYLDDGETIPHTIPTEYDLLTDWQHVAMVFDGAQPSTERVKLYVDGELFGSYEHGTSQIRDLNGPVTLGALNPDYISGGDYVSYDGWLDGVRIYRRPLSASEVEDVYGITPAAHWDFDDGSGSIAMDLTENALDIALQGTYAWTTGVVGGALELGGQSTSYGTLNDPDELENTDKLSFAFWVKPENLDGNARFVVSKRDSADVNSAYSLFFATGNSLYVDLDKNHNANRHITATQFENDTWYHVGVVYDGTLPQSERGRVYIDGELDANSPFGVSSASIPNYSSDFHLGIANSGYTTTFGGEIDDLQIFRAALTESEVEDLVAMGDVNPTPPSSDWLSHSQVSRAPAPLLRFTDLVNGPATGLGDGLGEGAIVTVWAQGIGDSQGASKAYFTDAQGVKREAAHVYYWKRADGELPSGPARLWYSHLMQEVAFSIPGASAPGEGQITLEVDGVESNPLPFTVRSGNIYHVKSTGDNGNSGSFSQPFASARFAMGRGSPVPAGSLVYVHDVDSGSLDNVPDQCLYFNNGSASSSRTAHMATVAYPGFQPKVIGQRAVANYQVEGWVVSKLDVYASNYRDTTETGQPTDGVYYSGETYGIQTSRYGRVIGNRITDIFEGCANRFQGAIKGQKLRAEAVKLFGNEVYDYGCPGTGPLHHTTYMSIRDESNPTIEAWEWGWMFLHGNHAKFGIHNFDIIKNDSAQGKLADELLTHDCVVVEQGGAGIQNGTSTGWDTDSHLYNNVLIQTGMAAAWDGVDPLTANQKEAGGFALYDTDWGYNANMYLYDNLVWGHTEDLNMPTAGFVTFIGSFEGGAGFYDWSRNVGINTVNMRYFGYGYRAESKIAKVQGSDNFFFANVPNPLGVPAGGLTNSYEQDPKLTRDGCIITVQPDSPLIGKGRSTGYDIYGVPRAINQTIGPVEAQ